MNRIRLLIIYLMFSVGYIFAQSSYKEKRIYLIDVTASMIGKGELKTPDIFNTVKEKLSQSIYDIQSPYTEVTIIPFSDKPFQPITGHASQADSLVECISKIDIRKGDTNIADAWMNGISRLDSTKINYLFLLTDGLHNHGVETDSLYSILSSWPKISSGKHMFAYYVMLTPEARDLEITKIVDQTPQMWLIESMDINASFISSSLNIAANVFKNKRFRIPFRLNNKTAQAFNFKIQLEENPYYRIKSQSLNFADRHIDIELEELKPHIEMPLDITLKLTYIYDKVKYPITFFTPEVINFHISNKGIRTMNIKAK